MNQTESADQFGHLQASLKLVLRLLMMQNQLMPALLAAGLDDSACLAGRSG